MEEAKKRGRKRLEADNKLLTVAICLSVAQKQRLELLACLMREQGESANVSTLIRQAIDLVYKR